MARENKVTVDTQSTGVGVKRKPGRQRGHLQTISHGLYFHPDKFAIDGRSTLGQALSKIVRNLLEPFPQPAPAMAQLLAQRCSYKLVRAASYEMSVISGNNTPALSADQDYLRLTGSIRSDIQAIYGMLKDGNLADRAPDLKEYLETLRKAAKAQVVEVERA
jgi:hypothetical protein